MSPSRIRVGLPAYALRGDCRCSRRIFTRLDVIDPEPNRVAKVVAILVVGRGLARDGTDNGLILGNAVVVLAAHRLLIGETFTVSWIPGCSRFKGTPA